MRGEDVNVYCTGNAASAFVAFLVLAVICLPARLAVMRWMPEDGSNGYCCAPLARSIGACSPMAGPALRKASAKELATGFPA